MKTKHPESEIFNYKVTPDYSPRMPRVVISERVRENGRLLSQRCMSRSSWRGGSAYYEPLDSPLEVTHEHRINIANWQESLMESETMNSSATASPSAPEVFTARVVSDEIALFDFHPDEDACEVDDVRLQLPVEEEIVTARIVSSEVAPFKWVEDDPDLDDERLRFETPKVRRRARIVSIKEAAFKWVSDDE